MVFGNQNTWSIVHTPSSRWRMWHGTGN